MADHSDDLERLSREQLILKARVLGVERAELMTRVEMRDEIVRRSEPDLAQQKRARGFLGVARDLVASVVEAGLNLPDAAALIRGDANRETHWKGPPPVATVTLAEIYAAQGHLDRALRMLDEVLAKEPDHDPARALRTRLATATDLPVAPPRRRQKVSFVENANVNVAAPESETPAPPASASDNANVDAPMAEPASASDPANVDAPIAEPAPASENAALPLPELAADEAPAVPASASGSVNEYAPPIAEPAPASASGNVNESAPTAEPALASASASGIVNESAPIAAPTSASENVPAPAPDLAAAGEAPATAASGSEDLNANVPALPVSPTLLTLSLSGQRQIYWELPPQSLAALQKHSPNGHPLVRVISFRTRSGRVERQTRDLSPDSEVGFAVLPDLRADAVVRAVLGWEAEGRFMPYVIASDLPSGNPSARRKGPFRASPLVGPVAHEAELRALSHCSSRPAR